MWSQNCTLGSFPGTCGPGMAQVQLKKVICLDMGGRKRHEEKGGGHVGRGDIKGGEVDKKEFVDEKEELDEKDEKKRWEDQGIKAWELRLSDGCEGLSSLFPICAAQSQLQPERHSFDATTTATIHLASHETQRLLKDTLKRAFCLLKNQISPLAHRQKKRKA